MNIQTFGRVSAVHLWMLRAAARTGHIRLPALAVGRIFPHGSDVLIRFDEGGVLAVSLHDSYWARILVGWEHEPDVRWVLDSALAYRPDAVLFDCGANIGYWAARYAARVPVIAVEAVQPTYLRLVGNASRNGFQTIHAAVWDESGRPLTVQWNAAGEAAASVTQQQGIRRCTVVSVTLDDLYHAGDVSGRLPIVKLDVEGAEVQAIDGARTMRDRTLWIYEDHGQDRTHKVTAHFLQLGFKAFYADGARLQQITCLGQLDKIKADFSQGYNFIALQADGPWGALPRLS